jgi:large subunit ribosomal protein L34
MGEQSSPPRADNTIRIRCAARVKLIQVGIIYLLSKSERKISAELTSLFFSAKINNMSITYQPKKRKRKKVHGFLKRKRTKGGRRVLRKRMKKGRWKLTV